MVVTKLAVFGTVLLLVVFCWTWWEIKKLEDS